MENIVQLLDVRRRHADVLEIQKQAEAQTLQLKTDFTKSEALRNQLERDLRQAQAGR